MIPKRILNVDPNNDQQGQELNNVDWFASDFVNIQEYNRFFTGALASGLFWTNESGGFKNEKYSRGAIILDGMEYVDIGSNQVEIKSGYFASTGYEVVYFEGGQFDISTQKIINIRRSDNPTAETRIFGDQQPKNFAVKYSAVVTQKTVSEVSNTISVEYNFNNLNNGDSVVETVNTIKGVILRDYLGGIKSSNPVFGTLDPNNLIPTGDSSIICRNSADGYSLEIDIRCQLATDNDSTNGGDRFILIGTLPAGFWRSRTLSNGNVTSNFSTPVNIDRVNGSDWIDVTPASLVIDNSGNIYLNRLHNLDGTFPEIKTDSFINTSFSVNYRTSVNGEMLNDRQWKRLES